MKDMTPTEAYKAMWDALPRELVLRYGLQEKCKFEIDLDCHVYPNRIGIHDPDYPPKSKFQYIAWATVAVERKSRRSGKEGAEVDYIAVHGYGNTRRKAVVMFIRNLRQKMAEETIKGKKNKRPTRMDGRRRIARTLKNRWERPMVGAAP